ncbi:SRPBCC family protein [Nocardia abscessus]|uniref:SRPBCC family protein n=1 Tax=Nocardia abscessus TaxID=120957 RepID=UPI002458D339|nr:SRPBCC family protein [Nocardia abscessus]
MTRRTTTYTQFIALPAERIWQVLADPERWPEWNPDITAVRLSGTVTVGSRGTYVPKGRTHRVLHPRAPPCPSSSPPRGPGKSSGSSSPNRSAECDCPGR